MRVRVIGSRLYKQPANGNFGDYTIEVLADF